jgi:succinoglycan biosynthesis protein ExoA
VSALGRTDRPFVSVIMPVRDEADFLGRSLDAVFDQDYPADRIEVIVADGMSRDGTREIVLDRQRRLSNLFLVDNPGRIVPTGMNAGIARSRGEVVIRVDGHCEIAKDYVSRCVAHLEAGTAEGVGGVVETVGRTPAARAVAMAMSSRLGVGDSSFRVLGADGGASRFVDTVPFPAYPRGVIERAGPYDEELVRNQDDEYNYRLRKLGGRLLLAGDVRSVYYSRGSLASLWRQYFQYGFWKVRVLQKHPGQMRARQFAPPLLVAGFAAAALLAPVSKTARRAAVAGAALYALGVGAGALAASKREPRLAPRVALAMAALHFGYGSGFWKGLVRFRDRWRGQ